MVLLARMVAPAEFGLLTLLAIFVSFSQTIIDSGFSAAIIQKKEVSRTDISTVFLFNFGISVLLYFTIFSAAPWIGEFYEEPRLVLLIRVLALDLIVSAIGKIQNCLLVKNLAFKALFKITTPSLAIGGFVGILMANCGFEVWALVSYQMTVTLLTTCCYWVYSDREYWPRLEFSFASLREMAAFGLNLLGARISNQVVLNMYGVIIGKAFSFGDLAFYNRGRSFHQAPAAGLNKVLNRVLFPVFSQIQDDNSRIRSALRKGIPVVLFLLLPMMAFLMCAAEHIVVFLLTKDWIQSARYLRWFPAIGMMFPLSAILLSVLRAKGFSGLFLAISIAKNVMSIVVLLLTIRDGILAIVVGQVAVAAASLFLFNMPACHFVCKYTLTEQLADMIPYVLCTAFAATACVVLDSTVRFDSSFVNLTLQGIVFLFAYISVARASKLYAYGQTASQALSLHSKTVNYLSHWSTRIFESRQ